MVYQVVRLLFFAKMTFWKPPSRLLRPNNIRKLFKEAHPYIKDASVEHCVPRSLYKQEKQLGRDMHNLLSMPQRLNAHRSNFRLVDNLTCTLEHEWKDLGFEYEGAKKNTKKQLFLPPEQYKGLYARAIGYFYLLYPQYQDPIRRCVLDPGLILQWDSEYPPSGTETGFHDRIARLQENENPLLVKSIRDEALHEIWNLTRQDPQRK